MLKLNDQYTHPEVEGPASMKRVANCEAAVFLVAEIEGSPRGFIKAVYDISYPLSYGPRIYTTWSISI